MAKTFRTEGLGVVTPHDPLLTYITVELPEDASETWPAGSPVKAASGFVAEWVSVADGDIIGFVMEAGQNNASAGAVNAKVLLAHPQLVIEANFLGASAADNVLAAADLFIERDLIKDANLLGTGEAGWYIKDAADGAAVIIQEFNSAPVQFSTTNDYKPVAGDTNARIRAAVKPGVSAWF